MAVTPDWSEGAAYLTENAPELRPLIEKFSPCTLQAEKQERYFEILVRGMIAQQLAPEIVNKIMDNLHKTVGTLITPENITAASDEDLLAAGVVAQKIAYIKNLAHLAISGILTPDKFDDMTDSEITKQLLEVKGLGQWTIDMFLLLALCRTDIVPTADHIFQKALMTLLDLPNLPKRGETNRLSVNWRPWRSLAVWYLWRFGDEK